MTERERLIELIGQKQDCGQLTIGLQTHAVFNDFLADYLLANGVIVPPVALGSRQKVYVPVDGSTVVCETKVYGIGVDEDGDMVINPHEYPKDAFSISGYNIGKTVFLSREDAEKALKERSEGK